MVCHKHPFCIFELNLYTLIHKRKKKIKTHELYGPSPGRLYSKLYSVLFSVLQVQQRAERRDRGDCRIQTAAGDVSLCYTL